MYRVFICFCILGLGIIGCLTGPLMKTVEVETASTEPAKPERIAELHLSLEKGVYSADEPIPLRLSVRAGKFDLLVPAISVEEEGAFAGVVITDAAGKELTPTSPIPSEGHVKNLLHDGQALDCIHGVELKSRAETVAALEDLRAHFNFAPGDYTLQVRMNLRVYREFLRDQSPMVVLIEKDILEIQRSRHRDEVKREAISHLRAEIAAIQREQEEVFDKIYLPLDSLRGKARLESNTVTLRVE